MGVRLHVNVDHVATLRQARGTAYPDPVEAARVCEDAGADGITVHLREDRRHIQDRDVEELRRRARRTLNLEMAATDEMVRVATRLRPDVVTLVPERREERTTEGGLDVAGALPEVRAACARLLAAGVRTHVFIDPEEAQIEASLAAGARGVELHTGDYAGAVGERAAAELDRLRAAAACAARRGPSLVVAAGHGLTTGNVPALVAALPALVELNIGHAVVADAVFVGLGEAVRAFRRAIAVGEARR